MKRVIVLLFLIVNLLLVAGCTAADPYPEDVYFGDIYTHGILIGAGGAEADPVFTGSPAFGITVGNIASWTGHPLLTTGTHGVAGTIVGTSDVQSLTNKQLTMNNGDIIYWKDAGGVPQAILLLGGGGFNIMNPTGNGLNLNYNYPGSIYLWGSDEGTGEVLVLYGSDDVTAIDTVHDSPTVDLGAWYWDGGAPAGWEATIIHDMITAGAAPKSQLNFSINSANILKLENNSGVVRTWLNGNLSITAGAIDMSQIGAEPASTANRAGIYAIDLSADNCTIGFNTETAVLGAVAVVSTNKIPIRWNGVTYYLLVTTVP